MSQKYRENIWNGQANFIRILSWLYSGIKSKTRKSKNNFSHEQASIVVWNYFDGLN